MQLPGQLMSLLDVQRFLVNPSPDPDPISLGGFAGPSPIQEFHDGNGIPLSFGKIWSYVAGTTTPLAMWADSTGTTALDNPLILDVYGRTAFWLSPGTAYKLVLLTANDEPVWTQDPVRVPWFDAQVYPADIPTGAMMPYTALSAPDGWLICDGALYQIALYPALYAVLGDTFNLAAPDGYFCVPDLKQRFALGVATAGTGAALAETGGVIDHGHSAASHTHTGPAHTHTVVVASDGTQGVLTGTIGQSATVTSSSSGTAVTSGVTLASSGTNPPWMSLAWIIKT